MCIYDICIYIRHTHSLWILYFVICMYIFRADHLIMDNQVKNNTGISTISTTFWYCTQSTSWSNNVREGNKVSEKWFFLTLVLSWHGLDWTSLMLCVRVASGLPGFRSSLCVLRCHFVREGRLQLTALWVPQTLHSTRLQPALCLSFTSHIAVMCEKYFMLVFTFICLEHLLP